MNIDTIKKYKLEKGKNMGQKVLDAFDCDINWQALMMNRKFLVAIIKTIFKEAGVPKDVRFSGAFVYGSIEKKGRTDLTDLQDEETVDLVSSKLKGKHPRRGGKQHIYNSFKEFIEHRKPMKHKRNIYFFGDASSAGEYVSVHWTCFVIDLVNKKPVLLWFDPLENNKINFKDKFHLKKAWITDFLVNNDYVSDARFIISEKSPQQIVCAHPAQDVFCQTWVLMFMAVYIDKNPVVFSRFTEIDWSVWQNEPLKLWLNCLRKRMPKTWENTLFDDKYKGFFTICRKQVKGSKYDVKLKSLKPLPINEKESCIENIINYFYEK